MELEISESPERWVIIKIIGNEFTYYKVFGTWTGGYLYGDRWQLNSGIVKVEQDDEYYYFIGVSGSCYECHKNAYGTASSYGSRVLKSIIEKSLGCGIVLEEEEIENFIKSYERRI